MQIAGGGTGYLGKTVFQISFGLFQGLLLCLIGRLIDEPFQVSVHPVNKYDVGLRLGRLALAQVYGKDAKYAGPTFEKMVIEGSKVRLQFSHTDGGLKTRDGGLVKGFAIAGKDGVYVWADASIDGSSLVLSSATVKEPVNARYDWAMNPIGNLDNGFGLPAFPFRTDPEQGLVLP